MQQGVQLGALGLSTSARPPKQRILPPHSSPQKTGANSLYSQVHTYNSTQRAPPQNLRPPQRRPRILRLSRPSLQEIVPPVLCPPRQNKALPHPRLHLHLPPRPTAQSNHLPILQRNHPHPQATVQTFGLARPAILGLC